MDCSVGIGCSEGQARSAGRGVEKKQVPRWIHNRIAEESAQIYHKFDNARGSDFA